MDWGPLRGRRSAGMVLGLVICLLSGFSLSSCSNDDPEPGPSSSVVPAETSTPEVTATPPPLRTWYPTADSAVAFIKYFYDVYNYSYASLDTSLLQEISTSSCKTCSGMIENVKSLKQQGFKVTGNESLFVDAVFPTDQLTDNHLYVLVVMSQRPGTAIDRDGTATKVNGTKLAKNGFGLDWDGGKWLVQGISDEGKGTPWTG